MKTYKEKGRYTKKGAPNVKYIFRRKINSGLPFFPISISVLAKHFCMLRIFDICKPMCTIAPGVI